MPDPIFLAPLDGDFDARTDAGDVTLIGTGAARFATAEAGPEPAGQNFAYDPLNVVGTKWGIADGQGGLGYATSAHDAATVPDWAPAGARAFKVMLTTAGEAAGGYMAAEWYANEGGNNGALPPVNADMVASVWVYHENAETVDVGIRYAGWSFDFGITHYNTLFIWQVPPREWMRIYVTTNVGPVQPHNVYAWIVSGDPLMVAGDATWVIGGQVELGTEPSSLIVGDLGDGYSWAGAEHASFSRRADWVGGRRALVVEEATTNTIWNPIYAYPTPSGWFVDPSWSIAQDKAVLCDGQPTVRIDSSGTTDCTLTAYSDVGAYVVGDPVTTRLFLRSNRAGAQYRVQLYSEGVPGAVSPEEVVIPSTDDWTEVVISVASLPAGVDTGMLSPYIYADAPQAGDALWVGTPQLEKKAYATSFAMGSLGTGYTWAGTAHASASSRAQADVSVAITGRVSPTEGTVAVRYLMPDTSDAGRFPSPVELGQLAVGKDRILIYAYAGRQYFFFDTNNVQNGLNAGSVAEGEAVTTICRWTETTFSVLANGELASAAKPAPAGDITNSGADELLYIGGTGWEGSKPNAPVGPVLFFSEALGDSDAARLAAAAEWSWDVLEALGLAHLVVAGASRLAGAPVIAGDD